MFTCEAAPFVILARGCRAKNPGLSVFVEREELLVLNTG
jgi:hypothetical protein